MKRFLQVLKGLGAVLVIALCVVVILNTSGAQSVVKAQEEPALLAENPVLFNYQGLLLDPSTSAPKPNGDYKMTFKLYDAEGSTSPLWTESKTIRVEDGLFSTLLGDLDLIPTDISDGRPLYLGITIGDDPETTPRQRLGYTAGAVYAKNSDQLDGLHGSSFVNTSGGTMTGNLTVPGITYFPARTQVISIPGESFVSRDNKPFQNGGGMGGAYQLTSETGCLVSGLNLPHGSVITQFKAYFHDNSINDLNLYLLRLSLSGTYVFMSEMTTSGTPEFSYQVDTSIVSPTIDNNQFGYVVMACGTPKWSGDFNLRVMGASITYTISEAH